MAVDGAGRSPKIETAISVPPTDPPKSFTATCLDASIIETIRPESHSPEKTVETSMSVPFISGDEYASTVRKQRSLNYVEELASLRGINHQETGISDRPIRTLYDAAINHYRPRNSQPLQKDTWEKIKALRNKVCSLRSRLSEKRIALQELELAKSVADDNLIKFIRTHSLAKLGLQDNSDGETLTKHFEECEKLRTEYGPLEDDFTMLENLLDDHEFEIQLLENTLYEFWKPGPRSRRDSLGLTDEDGEPLDFELQEGQTFFADDKSDPWTTRCISHHAFRFDPFKPDCGKPYSKTPWQHRPKTLLLTGMTLFSNNALIFYAVCHFHLHFVKLSPASPN
jgi:hypothetical protein